MRIDPAWRRPTLPRLETQYHRRGGVSRPSSGWDRVGDPRHGHQAGAMRVLGVFRWAMVDQAVRTISTGQLHMLPCVHARPIDVVVFHGSHARPGFEGGFPLRCFQRLSRPNVATLQCRGRDNRSTRGPSIPVLSYWGQLLSSLVHPRQIGTELSHDVLNPAHVPL